MSRDIGNTLNLSQVAVRRSYLGGAVSSVGSRSGVLGPQHQRHEGTVRTGAVVGERSAGLESHGRIERPRRRRPSLETHTLHAAGAGHSEEVVDHRSADPSTPRRRGRVHRLDLGVMPFEVPQRANAEELALEAEAVDRDRRIEEAVRVERVDVFGRRVRHGEREMARQQGPDVVGPRVVDLDLADGRGVNLENLEPAETLRCGKPPLQWDYILVSAVPGYRSAGTISGN